MAEYNDARRRDASRTRPEQREFLISQPKIEKTPSEPERAIKSLWTRVAVLSLKLLVVVLVALFVGRTFINSWSELSQRQLSFSPLPAFAACVTYFCGQMVLANFWRQVLLQLGQPAPLRSSFVAYYLSQLGKYVPGKASVVLIRTERILTAARRDDIAARVSTPAIAASVFYETLTLMAVGSLLSAVLTATTPGGDPRTIALTLALAVVCVTPTVPPVFAWLLRRVTSIGRRRAADSTPIVIRHPYRLVAIGVASSLVTWTLMGVAVWLTGESLGATAGLGVGNLRLWVLAATLPAVAGFVSLLPAGLVVREALVLGLLAPTLGEANALAVTIATRLIGVGTEVVVCASLVVGGFLQKRLTTAPQHDAP